MTDISNKYQDNYQYLFGYTRNNKFVYKFTDEKLSQIYKKENSVIFRHSFYEIISESEINFYLIRRYHDQIVML